MNRLFIIAVLAAMSGLRTPREHPCMPGRRGSWPSCVHRKERTLWGRRS